MTQSNWTPWSWRHRTVRQAPAYPDAEAVGEVEGRLNSFPPLVSIAEIRRLKSELAAVSERSAFILQGGDCAESFADFSPAVIRSTYTVLQDMASTLGDGTGTPVVRIGRMAGQYAKPRSSDMEKGQGRELPSYRGDIINGFDFREEVRRPDPRRMEMAYFMAAGTLNLLRSFASESGSDTTGASQETPFYTSHEALLLPYEQALSRQDEDTGQWYDCSGHFLWIGDRTRQLDGGHVEFLRGVANPIGMKVGPSMRPDELVRLTEVLNPANEPGRLTLISRMGANHIDRLLPPLLKAVKAAGRSVLWICDPMHGNTNTTTLGMKTRDFRAVLSEVQGFFYAHTNAGTYPAGIHLELTGQEVTECVGGAARLSEADLPKAYRTCCDPRLNREQSLELAELIQEELKLLDPAGAGLPEWNLTSSAFARPRPRRATPALARLAFGAR